MKSNLIRKSSSSHSLCSMLFTFLFTLLCSLAAAAGKICLSIDAGLDKMCARDTRLDSTCPKEKLAWRYESCVNIENEIIPELLKNKIFARADQTIPQNIYAIYKTEIIAQTLTYRYFQNVIRPVMTSEDVLNPGYDIYKEAFPIMAFRSELIRAIVTNGFLNQHQTGTSLGILDQNRRKEVENRLFQFVLEPQSADLNDRFRPVNFLRPKYAFAGFEAPHPSVKPYYISKYGNIFAVFRDRVKKRALFTNQDTLDHFSLHPNLPLRMNSYYSLFKNFNYPRKGQNYYEAQIWGRLDFSEVAYLLAGCFTGVDERIEYFIKELRDLRTSTPVFGCSVVNVGGMTKLVPGSLLYGRDGESPESLRAK